MRLIYDFLFPNIELKIELPGANRVGYIPFFISNSQTDLNEFGFLNIRSYQKILSFFLASGPLNLIPAYINTWELCVHSDHIKSLCHLHQFCHLFFKVVRPHIANVSIWESQ